MRIKNIGKEYSCQKTIYIVVASGLLLVVLFGSFLYKKIGLNNVDSKELARLASYKSTLNFDDTMPKIGYVGKGQLVVYDNMGVYVYDLSSSDLTTRFTHLACSARTMVHLRGARMRQRQCTMPLS